MRWFFPLFVAAFLLNLQICAAERAPQPSGASSTVPTQPTISKDDNEPPYGCNEDQYQKEDGGYMTAAEGVISDLGQSFDECEACDDIESRETVTAEQWNECICCAMSVENGLVCPDDCPLDSSACKTLSKWIAGYCL